MKRTTLSLLLLTLVFSLPLRAAERPIAIAIHGGAGTIEKEE
ncbi:hypothetical protein [Microbulbifer taiwanensis]